MTKVINQVNLQGSVRSSQSESSKRQMKDEVASNVIWQSGNCWKNKKHIERSDTRVRDELNQAVRYLMEVRQCLIRGCELVK